MLLLLNLQIWLLSQHLHRSGGSSWRHRSGLSGSSGSSRLTMHALACAWQQGRGPGIAWPPQQHRGQRVDKLTSRELLQGSPEGPCGGGAQRMSSLGMGQQLRGWGRRKRRAR